MRKLIVIAVSVTVAVSAGIFVYLNSESRIDELFEANVEALTQWEDGNLNERIWWRERETMVLLYARQVGINVAYK